MRRRLPPLTTLEGFDAAARLGSFAAAAEALNLTQSAISHQVRLLEEALGQKLFRRLHRKVVLTDAGTDFQRSVSTTLDQLRAGVDRLEPFKKPGSVVVYCDPALANSWLVPRLPHLAERHPGIDIWLDTTGRAVDFERDEVDVLIRRYERQQAPLFGSAMRHSILFEETLRPAAAPDVARRIGRAGLDSGLRQTTLLHEEGFDGWPFWFRDHGDRRAAPDANQIARGPNFSDAHVMLRVAAAGLGVALASNILARPFIADRTLAWLTRAEIETPFGYVVAASEEGLRDPDIANVFGWMCGQADAELGP